MSDEVLIRCENVGKKFCRDLKSGLWYGVRDVIADLKGHSTASSLRHGEFWANSDISFELRRGECLALLGRNGAGKTTLLKLLTGIIKPDRGSITISGQCSALIALGAGFNPVLTGRENISVNGSILGLSRRQTKDKLEEIVEFSELSEFIDTPVRNYSSGMQVRLGFASAVTLIKPDVLILDEVLAVGDAGFRSKCYTAIGRLASQSAVVLVSHAIAQVSRLATTGIVLKRGKQEFLGATPEAIAVYENQFEIQSSFQRFGTGQARIDTTRVVIASSQIVDLPTTVEYGNPLTLELVITASTTLDNVVVDIGFRNLSDEIIAECNNFVLPRRLDLAKGRNVVRVSIPSLELNPGRYCLSGFVLSANMVDHYDWIPNLGELTVMNGKPAIAGYQISASWDSVDR